MKRFVKVLSLILSLIMIMTMLPFATAGASTAQNANENEVKPLEALSVSGIEITKLPDRTEYIAKHHYDLFNNLNGMEIKITYSDGSERLVDYENNQSFYKSSFKFSGDCMDQYGYHFELNEGINEIAINYSGQQDTFTYTGIGIENIEVTDIPDKEFLTDTRYYLHQYAMLNGMEIDVTYSGGETKHYRYNDIYQSSSDDEEFRDSVFLVFSELVFSGTMFDGNWMTPKEGENIVIVTYGGQTTQFIITGLSIDKIEITKPSAKTEFLANTEYTTFEFLKGMEVDVTFSSGETKTYAYPNNWGFISDNFKFTGDCITQGGYYFNLKVGENTVYLTCGGKSAEFTLIGIEVASIEITKTPSMKYLAGQTYDTAFDLLGMEIKLTYTNGDSVLYYNDYFDDWDFFLNEITYSGDCMGNFGYFTPVEGENTITLTCSGKTADFTFTAISVKGLEVTKESGFIYITGTKYYLSNYLFGTEVTVHYSDDSSITYNSEDDRDFFGSKLEFKGDSIDEYGRYFTPEDGENEITIAYGGKETSFTLIGSKVEDIEVTSQPIFKLVAGEKYYLVSYLRGMELTVTYTNGLKKAYDFIDFLNLYYYDLEFSNENLDGRGYSTPVAGENKITVSYEDKSAEFVFWADYEGESIAITKLPTQTEFMAGNEYNIYDYLAGMEITYTYVRKDAKVFGSQIFTYENNKEFFNNLEFSGDCIDKNGNFTPIVGENKIIINYDGKTAELTIIGVELTSIKITQSPAKTEFEIDTEYNIYDYLAGMELTLTYSNNTTQVYTYEDNQEFFKALKFSGDCIDEKGNFTPISGKNIITVTYEDKTAELTIIGVEPELVSIEVTKLPTQTEFEANTEYNIFDCLSGMEITLTYSNNKTKVYTYEDNQDFFKTLKFSGDSIGEDGKFTPVAGNNVITVAYEDKLTEFTVTGVELTSIEITQLPNQTEFEIGSVYNIYDYLAGMEITLKYSNGKTEVYTYEDNKDFFEALELSFDSVDEYGNFVPIAGENTITVTYKDKSSQFTVIGVEPKLLSLKITAYPNQKEFEANKEYDFYNCLAGLEVSLSYSNGITKVYNYETDEEFFRNEFKFIGECINENGVMKPVAGENTITLSYNGLTEDFVFIGIETKPELVSIDITELPTQTKFIAGNEYSIYDYLAGMEVTLTYSDDTTEIYTYEDNEEFFKALIFSGDCIDEEGNFTPVAGENTITVTYEGITTTFTVKAAILGDVNGDGDVSVKDATAIQMYLAGFFDETELDLDVADFNGDEDVSVKDATAIQMFLAGLSYA